MKRIIANQNPQILAQIQNQQKIQANHLLAAHAADEQHVQLQDAHAENLERNVLIVFQILVENARTV